VPIRLGILTSIETRHRYFVNALAARFDVVAIGYQETGYYPAATASAGMDAATAGIVAHHFDERRRQENIYFSQQAFSRQSSSTCAVRDLDPATLNSPETVRFLEDQNVDVVAVYGTNLIKPPLLDRFAGRMINMHLGLSPYYRGTATNFYPLLNDEPHITDDDMPPTVGCNAILAGIDKMIQALAEFEAGTLTTTPQWPTPNARLYRRADFHPSQVRALYDLIAAGLFPNFVARKHRVQNAFKLIP